MAPFRNSDLKLLERVFAREIEGSMYQTKAKRYAELEEMGYLQKITRSFGSGPLGEVTCTGYVLTFLGNFTYCMTCEDEHGPQEKTSRD